MKKESYERLLEMIYSISEVPSKESLDALQKYLMSIDIEDFDIEGELRRLFQTAFDYTRRATDKNRVRKNRSMYYDACDSISQMPTIRLVRRPLV